MWLFDVVSWTMKQKGSSSNKSVGRFCLRSALFESRGEGLECSDFVKVSLSPDRQILRCCFRHVTTALFQTLVTVSFCQLRNFCATHS